MSLRPFLFVFLRSVAGLTGNFIRMIRPAGFKVIPRHAAADDLCQREHHPVHVLPCLKLWLTVRTLLVLWAVVRL